VRTRTFAAPHDDSRSHPAWAARDPRCRYYGTWSVMRPQHRDKILIRSRVAVILLVKFAPAFVAGQSPAAADPAPKKETAAKPGPAPRTAWGEPDLQGIWTDEYQTPLQRAARFADKEFFTEEERAELDARRGGMLGRDRRGQARSERDVAGAYNAVFE